MLLLNIVGGLRDPGSPEASGLAEVGQEQADCLPLEMEQTERVSTPDGSLCWLAWDCIVSRHLEKKKNHRGL